MLEVSQKQLFNAIDAIGVHAGDGLLIHSAIQFLGRPTGGVDMYLDALMKTLDPGGTIAVPTFNFNFANGVRYDPQEMPSVGMGAFSEYVRQHPNARRTTHPMQSLAVIGQYADDLASRDTPSAFDPGSAYERMLDLDFDILLLGADINAVSMLHYSEQRSQVPYRYWKNFTGEIIIEDKWQTRTYRMYVRDMELDAQLSLKPVQRQLEAQNQWTSIPLNYGLISLCRMRDFVNLVDDFLTSDPWSLVINK
ncbi:MAG: AAC(3) family N-acetyltransferase [Chloroflexota bacterium]|nr:AAC(3) family N-acetyltransferase [Chloroflexota bacterium]